MRSEQSPGLKKGLKSIRLGSPLIRESFWDQEDVQWVTNNLDTKRDGIQLLAEKRTSE